MLVAPWKLFTSPPAITPSNSCRAEAWRVGGLCPAPTGTAGASLSHRVPDKLLELHEHQHCQCHQVWTHPRCELGIGFTFCSLWKQKKSFWCRYGFLHLCSAQSRTNERSLLSMPFSLACTHRLLWGWRLHRFGQHLYRVVFIIVLQCTMLLCLFALWESVRPVLTWCNTWFLASPFGSCQILYPGDILRGEKGCGFPGLP